MRTKLRIKNFIILVLALVLPFTYFLLKPNPTYSQDEKGKIKGQFTLKWKLTLYGKYYYLEQRQESHHKSSEEKKDEMTFVTSGEAKGTIVARGPDTPSTDVIQEQAVISNTVSGEHTNTFKSESNHELCYDTSRYGVSTIESTMRETYSLENPPAKDYPYLDLMDIYSSADTPKNFHYSMYYTGGTSKSWQIKQTSQIITTNTDACGKTRRDATDPRFSEGFNGPVGAVYSDAFGDKTFHGDLENIGGNNYRVTKTLSFEYSDGNPKDGMTTGNAKLEYTLTYEHEPSNLELIIIPSSDYDKWEPVGGTNEKTKGNDINVKVELRIKGRPALADKTAKLIFELIKTSRERGVCLNVPEEKLADQSNPFDVKFDEKSNSDYKITNEGQRAESKKNDISGSILINNYDWGGYTKLKVTAIVSGTGEKILGHLEGNAEKQELSIPKDDNNNFIADVWEESENILKDNLPPEWNEIDTPSGQKTKGDGISLYERYRGFEFKNAYNPNSPALKHERLKTSRKHVFIYDPHNLLIPAATNPITRDMSFIQISGFTVRLLTNSQWSGTGAFGELRRIVNFNYGTAHITDQHGLALYGLDSSDEVTTPFNPETLTDEPDRPGTITLGMAWEDNSSPRPMDSPANTYEIDIYINNIRTNLSDTLEKHTLGLAEFEGKAWEDLTPEQQQKVKTEASKYYKTHLDEYKKSFLKRKTLAISHELGHGIGIYHHRPATRGSKECVMRYFEELSEKYPNDRFELQAREPWPDSYCTTPNNTHSGKGCRIQIRATDKGK